MTRDAGVKRGKGRLSTKVNALAKPVPHAKSGEIAARGNLTTEIAGYTNDFNAVPLTNGIIPNPDDIMMVIAPSKQTKLAFDPYDLHRIMRRSDLKYKSLIQTRKNGVLSKEWSVLPNANDPDQDRAVRVAEFVTQALNGLENFQAVQECLLDAIPLGYAVSEILWKQKEIIFSDGTSMMAWVPNEIVQRRQGRFGFADDWSLRYQERAGKFVDVPYGKFIVHTHWKENGNRYGVSEASEVFWAWWLKHNVVKWWGIFAEKFGMPTAIAKVPRNFTDEQKQKVKAVLKAIQTEYGVVIPEGMMIEFLEAQRTGSTNTYKEFGEWCDKNLSEALTGQSLATGQGQNGKGSYAQSQTHENVKQEYVEADSKELMGTINFQLVNYLVGFNFEPGTPNPIWAINYESRNLDADLEIDTQLAKLGVPLPLRHFYATYKRPVPIEGEEVISGSSLKQLPGLEDDGEDPQNSRSKRKKEPVEDPDEEIEQHRQNAPKHFAASSEAISEVKRRDWEKARLMDALSKEGADVLGRLGDAIEAEIIVAHDLNDARERLQRIMAEGKFSDELANAVLSAKVNGYLYAAAQIQRYKNEVLEVEAEEDQAVQNKKRPSRRMASARDILADYDPLPPKEALDWFTNLVPLTKAELDNLPREAWGSSFSLGDFETRESLREIQMLINDFLLNGRTQQDFVKEYQAKRKELGLDPVENHRAEQIFRTETARAYGAGRTRSLNDPDTKAAFPMWQYIAVLDDRTRDQHIALNGYIAPPDDIFWLTKNPPWDYNCRCDVVPLTKRQIEKQGLEFSPTVTMPDGSEVDPRTWPTSPGFRGLGF